MLLTHSCNTCYLLNNLYFFFSWGITQQYHEKFVSILSYTFICFYVLPFDWFVILMWNFSWSLLITKENYVQLIRLIEGPFKNVELTRPPPPCMKNLDIWELQQKRDKLLCRAHQTQTTKHCRGDFEKHTTSQKKQIKVTERK